jgi:hypothetical protein
MQITRAFSFALLAIAAGACSSSSSGPDAPVIDNLTMPDTATVGTFQGQAAYDLKGTISFHDDSENVTSFLVHIDGAPDNPTGIPATKSETGLAVELGIGATAPKGPLNYTVTLYGASGKASTPLQKTVTLQ